MLHPKAAITQLEEIALVDFFFNFEIGIWKVMEKGEAIEFLKT